MQKLFCVSRKHVSKLYLYQGSRNSKQYLTSAGTEFWRIRFKIRDFVSRDYPTGYGLPKTSRHLMETSLEKLQEHCCTVTNSTLNNLVPNCFIYLTPIFTTFESTLPALLHSGFDHRGFNSIPMGKAGHSHPSSVKGYISKKCFKPNPEKQSEGKATDRPVRNSGHLGQQKDLRKGAKGHTSDNWNMWGRMEQLLLSAAGV